MKERRKSDRRTRTRTTMNNPMYECDYCSKMMKGNEVNFVYPQINEPIDQFKKISAVCEDCLIKGMPQKEKQEERIEFLKKIKELHDKEKERT